MNKKTVKDLIRSKETFRIERTVSTSDTAKFCQAICAFSNDLPKSGKPGYLLVGVDDDGNLSGLKVTDELLKYFAGLRMDGNTLPIPAMTVDYVSFDEGDVIVVKVLPAEEPPVRYKGRCYIRIGPRKDIASQTEENILSEKRLSSMRSFDMMPCREASLDDLDLTVFSVSVTNAKANSVNVNGKDSRHISQESEDQVVHDKSLKLLALCAGLPHTRKEMLSMIGVTNQTHNVRNIINPLILAGYITPVEEDKNKTRNVRFEITVRGKDYLDYQNSLSLQEKGNAISGEQQSTQEPVLFPDYK